MKAETELHLGRADELLTVAREILAHEHAADSINRSYYAMFHAATAVLLEWDIERRSHGGLIAAFSEFVVKPGLLDKRYHVMLRDAFDERMEGDYFAAPSSSIDEATAILRDAQEFVAACRRLLEKGGET